METENPTQTATTGFEPAPLRPCTALLSRRDFTVCRQLANKIPRSDPEISSQLDRIIAISDVLSAASRRLGDHPDHYSILNLRPSDASNRDLVRQQFKTLVRLLHPNKNKFPFADEALMFVREAWSLLSDPVRRDQFESQIHSSSSNSSISNSTASFWTMCPYCWHLHEYERKYKDCTFRCVNCKRSFHGAEVKAPTKDSVVKGKNQYYCYHVSLPLRYPVEDGEIGFEVMGMNNGRKRMRIKTVANRVRMKGFVAHDSDEDSDFEM